MKPTLSTLIDSSAETTHSDNASDSVGTVAEILDRVPFDYIASNIV